MSEFLDPRNEKDSFCTCPRCGLLGTHHVEVVAVAVPPGTVRMTHPKLPGQPIDVPEAGAPGHERRGWAVSSRRATTAEVEDGSAALLQAERLCVFCDHIWYTDARNPPKQVDRYLTKQWTVPLREPSGLDAGQVAALVQHGYPDLLPRGVTGRPGEEIVSMAVRDGRPLVLRNWVCYLDGIEIDGHEVSDLDYPDGQCIHCGADLFPEEHQSRFEIHGDGRSVMYDVDGNVVFDSRS